MAGQATPYEIIRSIVDTIYSHKVDPELAKATLCRIMDITVRSAAHVAVQAAKAAEQEFAQYQVGSVGYLNGVAAKGIANLIEQGILSMLDQPPAGNDNRVSPEDLVKVQAGLGKYGVSLTSTSRDDVACALDLNRCQWPECECPVKEPANG